MRLLLIAFLLLSACGCDYEVVADVIVTLDGGTVTPTSYCASPCSTARDCAKNEHCSPIVTGGSVAGLCFPN